MTDAIRDPRDLVYRTIVGQIDLLGFFILFALDRLWPEQVKSARLAFMARIGDPRKTLKPILDTLETFGYATHTGGEASESWRITDYGRDTLRTLIASTAASTLALPSASQPALPLSASGNPPAGPAGEILRRAPSSSSDQIRDQSDFSDQSDEEEAREEKIYLLKRNNISGPKAEQLTADPWVTPLRIMAWLLQVGEMKRTGFKFRKGPEAYAISCLLNHDEANQSAYHGAQRTLEVELRYMPRAGDDEDDEDEE